MLASQGLPAIVSTLALAGWGLLLVALSPPAAGTRCRCDSRAVPTPHPDARRDPGALGRRVRQQSDARRADRRPGADGAAFILARPAHAGGGRRHHGQHDLANLRADRFCADGGTLAERTRPYLGTLLRTSALIASGFLALQVGGFYLLQRRGFFSKLMRAASRFSGKRDWSQWLSQAQAIDLAVQVTYRRSGPVARALS